LSYRGGRSGDTVSSAISRVKLRRSCAAGSNRCGPSAIPVAREEAPNGRAGPDIEPVAANGRVAWLPSMDQDRYGISYREGRALQRDPAAMKRSRWFVVAMLASVAAWGGAPVEEDRQLRNLADVPVAKRNPVSREKVWPAEVGQGATVVSTTPDAESAAFDPSHRWPSLYAIPAASPRRRRERAGPAPSL